METYRFRIEQKDEPARFIQLRAVTQDIASAVVQYHLHDQERAEPVGVVTFLSRLDRWGVVA